MNLYEIWGEPTDGTWMSDYVQACITAAETPKQARDFTDTFDGVPLLGKKEKWTVKLIGTALPEIKKPKVISEYSTRDY